MIIKIIKDLTKQDGNLLKKIEKLIDLKQYHDNFQKGLTSGKIYHKLREQNSSLNELMKRFTEDDFYLIDILFCKDVEKFLNTQKLKTQLHFDERIGANQIGNNTIYLEKPITGLWTTGKATFFIPTKKGYKNNVSMEIQSIPPINVTIGFEGKEIRTFQMPKLATKEIEFSIPSSAINTKVSELFIFTDKLWLPSVILDIEKSVALGVGVKSINVSYA